MTHEVKPRERLLLARRLLQAEGYRDTRLEKDGLILYIHANTLDMEMVDLFQGIAVLIQGDVLIRNTPYVGIGFMVVWRQDNDY